MSRPSIAVVDDAPEVRALVTSALRVSGHFRVVGEGADGEAALALARRLRPDVLLLDVSMPGLGGLEALEQVLAVSPETAVVMYSGFDEHGLAERALELGARAYVVKSTPLPELIERLAALTGTPGSAGADAAPPAPDEAVLAEHLERFREVFEDAAIGMATMTLSGRLVRANRAFGEALGRDVSTLVGITYASLTSNAGVDIDAALAEITDRGVDVVQIEHGLAGASADLRVRATIAPVRDSHGRALYVFLQLQDVTAQRAAEEQLRQSEERFRLLVEAVQDYAIFMLDPQGRIASWNLGAERIKGYRAEEIIGRHFRVFYPPDKQAERHPEHELELALRDGHYEEEGWRVRKDGSRFWANVVITAIRNADGEHVGFTKVTRDTTERRRILDELERANEGLRQAADDQSQFLAVTAHELRTPVGVLAGTAETFDRHWAELSEDERRDLVAGMVSSAGRLRRLLDDLLTASRLQAGALELVREPLNLADVVRDAALALRRSHPDAVVEVAAPALLAVDGDRDRLTQALDNLLANALRHGAPPVRVSLAPVGEQAEIRVSDAGGGVAPQMQPRLFQRFATGRPSGGTGLGLFIVRELLRAHGGDASYDPGPPAAFVLRLPTRRPTD